MSDTDEELILHTSPGVSHYESVGAILRVPAACHSPKVRSLAQSATPMQLADDHDKLW